VGAPLRYLIDRTLQSRRDTVFPWVPFTVNLTASATLGFLTGAASAAIVSPPTPNP
jgi:CrcB protein